MRELWNENIKAQLQHLIPMLSVSLFVIIFSIPLYPFVSDTIRPCVTIICAYFWLIHRPYYFAVGSVYFIGILEDVLSSTPFGINILSLLIVYVLTNIAYKYVINKSFAVVWYAFIPIAFLTLIIKWLILSIYYSQFLPFIPLFFIFLTTIAFYPIFSMINAYICEYFMQDED